MDGSLISVGHARAHQRASGALSLAVRADGSSGKTRLADLYQTHPLRALFPRPSIGDPFTAAIATVSGGLAGGDRVDVDLRVDADADLLVAAQAAEKVYRSIDDEVTRVTLTMSVGPDAALEFLPRETILFDGARQTRRATIDLEGEGSRALVGDLTVFGRGAMGERFTTGQARDTWRVNRAGTPLWRDASEVTAERLAHPFGLDGATAMGTIVCVAPSAASLRDVARDTVAMEDGDSDGASIGATVLDDMLLIRLLGRDASTVRARFQMLWAVLRHRALSRPARLPPLIHC